MKHIKTLNTQTLNHTVKKGARLLVGLQYMCYN